MNTRTLISLARRRVTVSAGAKSMTVAKGVRLRGDDYMVEAYSRRPIAAGSVLTVLGFYQGKRDKIVVFETDGDEFREAEAKQLTGFIGTTEAANIIAEIMTVDDAVPDAVPNEDEAPTWKAPEQPAPPRNIEHPMWGAFS